MYHPGGGCIDYRSYSTGLTVESIVSRHTGLTLGMRRYCTAKGTRSCHCKKFCATNSKSFLTIGSVNTAGGYQENSLRRAVRCRAANRTCPSGGPTFQKAKSTASFADPFWSIHQHAAKSLLPYPPPFALPPVVLAYSAIATTVDLCVAPLLCDT